MSHEQQKQEETVHGTVVVAPVVLSRSEAEAIKREEKEDYLRDNECDWCRFIPVCRPSTKDHGVSLLCKPPCCPHSHKNYFFHSVFFHEAFGELGFHFLDYHRNFFFGLSTMLSLLGVAMLIVGASALVAEPVTLSNAYWSGTSARNSTINTDFKVSVGLRALMYSKCDLTKSRRLDEFAATTFNLEPVSTPFSLRRELATPPAKCVNTVLEFSDKAGCAATGVFGSVCTLCGDVVSSIAAGVAFAAIGKGVALFSMQKRMYAYADSPSLKFMGICTELMGFISLVSTIAKFHRNCVGAMVDQFTPDKYPTLSNIATHPGPGFNCFIVGAVASFVRLLLHLLTPLPHRGKGVCFPTYKIATMLCTCKGCCVLYDDEAEDKERAAKHAALHAGDQPAPVAGQLSVTHDDQQSTSVNR